MLSAEVPNNQSSPMKFDILDAEKNADKSAKHKSFCVKSARNPFSGLV